MEMIYLFNAPDQSKFCSGVFTSVEIAEKWIRVNKLSGILTAYPINIGVYGWAILNGLFSPKGEKHQTPEFKSGFSTASQEHYHYENGSIED